MLGCGINKFKSAVFFENIRKLAGHVFTIVQVDHMSMIKITLVPNDPVSELEVARGSFCFSPFESAIILITYIISSPIYVRLRIFIRVPSPSPSLPFVSRKDCTAGYERPAISLKKSKSIFSRFWFARTFPRRTERNQKYQAKKELELIQRKKKTRQHRRRKNKKTSSKADYHPSDIDDLSITTTTVSRLFLSTTKFAKIREKETAPVPVSYTAV